MGPPITPRREYVGCTIDDLRMLHKFRKHVVVMHPKIKRKLSEFNDYPIYDIEVEDLNRRPAKFTCTDARGNKWQGRLRENGICTFVAIK